MLRRKRASAAADQVRQILQSDTGNPAKNLTMHEIIFFVCSPAMKFQTLMNDSLLVVLVQVQVLNQSNQLFSVFFIGSITGPGQTAGPAAIIRRI